MARDLCAPEPTCEGTPKGGGAERYRRMTGCGRRPAPGTNILVDRCGRVAVAVEAAAGGGGAAGEADSQRTSRSDSAPVVVRNPQASVGNGVGRRRRSPQRDRGCGTMASKRCLSCRGSSVCQQHQTPCRRGTFRGPQRVASLPLTVATGGSRLVLDKAQDMLTPWTAAMARAASPRASPPRRT